MENCRSRPLGRMIRAMLYRFESFELDTAKVELRENGEPRPVERQVFALLALLVENRERLVSKDEILEKVWDGRIVSEAAVASRVKSARQALGDDGKSQRFIRTIHRQGFRFVARVTAERDVPPAAEPASAPAEPAEQPSIAVLPFRLIGDAGQWAAIADALPHELIAELSRLRWLFVTARGSSFRLRSADADMGEIGRLLGVRYCLSGTVEVANSKLAVTVELVDTRSGGVVWADHFAGGLDAVHPIRTEIRARILAALEIQIPLHEANLARLTVTENLDAWSAYHLGLQHMYRFNRKDNARPPRCSGMRPHAIPASRARMRACRSCISRPPSCATPKTSPPRSPLPAVTPSVRSTSTRSTRSSTSPWGARSGCRATSTAASAGSSARPPSARTMRRASMPVPGRRPWRDAASRAAAMSIWR
jgi:TolB-like protein